MVIAEQPFITLTPLNPLMRLKFTICLKFQLRTRSARATDAMATCSASLAEAGPSTPAWMSFSARSFTSSSIMTRSNASFERPSQNDRTAASSLGDQKNEFALLHALEKRLCCFGELLVLRAAKH